LAMSLEARLRDWPSRESSGKDMESGLISEVQGDRRWTFGTGRFGSERERKRSSAVTRAITVQIKSRSTAEVIVDRLSRAAFLSCQPSDVTISYFGLLFRSRALNGL
jgi:hypothetical protein